MKHQQQNHNKGFCILLVEWVTDIRPTNVYDWLSKRTNIIASTGTTNANIVPFSTDIQQLQKTTAIDEICKFINNGCCYSIL